MSTNTKRKGMSPEEIMEIFMSKTFRMGKSSYIRRITRINIRAQNAQPDVFILDIEVRIKTEKGECFSWVPGQITVDTLMSYFYRDEIIFLN